jgi:hypothetical protein
MVRRFDVGSGRNAEPGIVRASLAQFGSSPERPAVDFMVDFLQARGRLRVERELLRLSDKDGQKWPDEANEPGDMLPALFQRRPGARPARPAPSRVISDKDRLCLLSVPKTSSR